MNPDEKSKFDRNDVAQDRFCINYFVCKLSGKCVKVCGNTFQSIVEVGCKRLNAVCKNFLLNGTERTELDVGVRTNVTIMMFTAVSYTHLPKK